ncbi:MAG: dihydrolipoyl dehydrogenase [Deltaproteobacteria bacterium]|nr:dihydrolipoyl dehydrogenase [Deltaproteobacteria bacterium]
MSNSFDVVIIGTGPGGYVCAIRCAQLGLKTAVVERWPTFGGTCLNVGCIPSKALLESSELFHRAEVEFKKHGIAVDPTIDLATMHKRKDRVVASNTRGVAGLFKKNGVIAFHGLGSITGAGQVTVTPDEGDATVLTAEHIVIATGSEPSSIPGVDLDGARVVTSTEALTFDAVPERLAVIGAGVIGMEMGSVWNRLGAKVTVFEYQDRLFPFADKDVSKAAMKSFRKQKFAFNLGVAVQRTELMDDGVKVIFKAKGADEEQEFVADKVLVAVGRRPNTDGLGADVMGVALDKRGYVTIDSHWRTNVPGIYAIGDVVGGLMLAHKAEDEGIALAEQIAGKPGHVNYDAIPSVIYTAPEIASVGKTQEELEAAGVAFKSGQFPFLANGRAKAMEQKEGFVKILADATTDRILGVHMIGPVVGELIAEMVLAMEFGATAEDIARTCHAHPTLSEVVREAALDTIGRVIHF